MKKLTVWALLAMFVVAGAAFAAPAKVAPNASNFGGGAPATTNNDDSCDISVMPAATLLLPYFEVDEDPTGETTLFTITNVSAAETIAHVVLWTDYSYPVIDFNIYLTGYDVQAINLNDVIWRGIIAPASGDREDDGTGTDISPGDWDGSDDDPADVSDCVGLPGELPDFYVQRMQDAFTLGEVAGVPGQTSTFPACDTVGNAHDNAVGYATIDVVNICSTGLPTDGDDYFEGEIRFDNILIGDYQQVNSDEEFAQGNPMVHIRAVPELGGGTIDDVGDPGTNFDRTFYSRYQDEVADGIPGTLDRRQPLPSTFAARWISGGDTGFETSFKIWREGLPGVGTECDDVPANGELLVTESVIFDEDENGEGVAGDEIIVSPPIGVDAITLPETSLTNIEDDDVFPQGVPAIGGWVYLNLDNGTEDNIAGDNIYASQNWVVVSMRAEDRYSVDFDAAALGNGCTPPAEVTEFSEGGDAELGPAADFTPCYSCVE